MYNARRASKATGVRVVLIASLALSGVDCLEQMHGVCRLYFLFIRLGPHARTTT
jgi:hypothetical protein